ncbi:hypothetical protein CULT_300031 [[Clostridium] ultunense Esp]|nr:hypothetical protein CULT_300031 [[Clostridium] ultunense Esp]
MSGRKIKSVQVYALLFPMKKAFHIAKGMVGNPNLGAPHVYVSLTDEEGRIGWGEARPSPKWSDETQESIFFSIKNYFKPILIGEEPINIKKIYEKMDREIAPRLGYGQPMAKAAVEMALLDLIGKQTELPVSTMLFIPSPAAISLTYLISSRNPEEVSQEIMKAKEAGFKGIDLKIGFDVKKDLELVEAASSYGKEFFFSCRCKSRIYLNRSEENGKRVRPFSC